MTRGEIETAVRNIFEARKNNDVDALMALTAPDCGFRIVGSDRLGALLPRAAGPVPLGATLAQLVTTWDFCRMENVSVHVDGDTAFAHRAGEISFSPSGACFHAELMDKFTFRDGLVVDVVEFIDTLQAAQVLGLVAD